MLIALFIIIENWSVSFSTLFPLLYKKRETGKTVESDMYTKNGSTSLLISSSHFNYEIMGTMGTMLQLCTSLPGIQNVCTCTHMVAE